MSRLIRRGKGSLLLVLGVPCFFSGLDSRAVCGVWDLVTHLAKGIGRSKLECYRRTDEEF